MSQVYFGAHYPHDVFTGICCGLLLFLNRQYFIWYDVHDDPQLFENPQESTSPKFNHPIASQKAKLFIQSMCCFAVYAIFLTYFETEQIRKQLSFFFSLGNITCCILLRPFMQRIEDDHGKMNVKHFIIRMAVGLAAVFVISYASYKVYKSGSPYVDTFIFSAGFTMTAWTIVLGPRVFNALRIGTIPMHHRKRIKQN